MSLNAKEKTRNQNRTKAPSLDVVAPTWRRARSLAPEFHSNSARTRACANERLPVASSDPTHSVYSHTLCVCVCVFVLRLGRKTRQYLQAQVKMSLADEPEMQNGAGVPRQPMSKANMGMSSIPPMTFSPRPTEEFIQTGSNQKPLLEKDDANPPPPKKTA